MWQWWRSGFGSMVCGGKMGLWCGLIWVVGLVKWVSGGGFYCGGMEFGFGF